MQGHNPESKLAIWRNIKLARIKEHPARRMKRNRAKYGDGKGRRCEMHPHNLYVHDLHIMANPGCATVQELVAAFLLRFPFLFAQGAVLPGVLVAVVVPKLPAELLESRL